MGFRFEFDAGNNIDPAMVALETMGRENVNQLPVMSDGRVGGIVSRAAGSTVRIELKSPPSLLRAAWRWIP
jgi:predicted transcriptional regulator